MTMQALALTDDQLSQLRATAATVPIERRADLLKLVAGYLELEGGEASTGAFDRALTFALDHLYARNVGV